MKGSAETMKKGFTLLFSFSLLLAPLQASPPSRRPNILFLLSDDQRPDTISALGNPRIATPNLDKLVARGLTFTRANCSYPICAVSRAEIMTGRHGWENGIDGLPGGKLRADNPYWAKTFLESGYETWYVGKWHSQGRPSDLGFAKVKALFGSGGGKWARNDAVDWKGSPVTGYRGWVFQSEDGKEKHPELGVGLYPGIDTKFADAAIEIIRQGAGMPQPWFVHVNFTAPHDPLFAPPAGEEKFKPEKMLLPLNFLPEHPFDHGNLKGRDEMLMPFPRERTSTRELIGTYYSVIDFLDTQVGRILEAVERSGQEENTIIIYSSDHGLAVGSHGLRGKQNMYEHTFNVPLIIAGPGIPSNEKTSAQVYLRDLFPTTCTLANIRAPASVTAKSFDGVIRNPQEPGRASVFGYFRDSQRMIRSGRWKLIHYPLLGNWQLFDLESDPDEITNLYFRDDLDPLRTRLTTQLQAWQKENGDPTLNEASD